MSQYSASVDIGGQSFTAVFDTGSSLTWVDTTAGYTPGFEDLDMDVRQG